MKYLLAQKQGMSQIFDEEGNLVPVTLLWACPNTVTQVKTEDREDKADIVVILGQDYVNH